MTYVERRSGAFLLAGGWELERISGGVLYEMPSIYEKSRGHELMEALNEPIPPGCYPVKSSVEGERVKKVKRTRRFFCDGAMFRHTKHKRKDAPMDCRRSHEVCCNEDGPAIAIQYQHLMEDLTPFDCDVYWQTIWTKCEACHTSDLQFEAWVRSQSCGNSESDDSDEPVAASFLTAAGEFEVLKSRLTESVGKLHWLSDMYSFGCLHGGPPAHVIRPLTWRVNNYFSLVASHPTKFLRWWPMVDLLANTFGDLIDDDVANAILAESLDCFALGEDDAMHWLRTAIFIKAIANGVIDGNPPEEAGLPANVVKLLDDADRNPGVVFWNCTTCRCVKKQHYDGGLPEWLGVKRC